MDSVSPSLEGRRGRASVATTEALASPRSAEGFSNGLRGASFDWVSFLKVLIAVLTAIAGSIGVVSCMA